MYRPLLIAWTLSIATAAPLAWAQSAPSKSDPLDAKAAVPQLIYRSSLADYRVFPDDKLGSWKEANENVGRIGGWRAYAREAQQAEPDPTPGGAEKPVPVDSPKPMHGGQGGRKMN